MKVAEAQYTGPMRTHHRKGPSGERYQFRNSMGGGSNSVEIMSVEDARKLDQQDVFDVEWTPQGKVARMVAGRVDDTSDVVKELTYRQKQKLVGALDLDIAGNAKEDEIEEALEPVVEEMQHHMEME